jgi:hypothetical protein
MQRFPNFFRSCTAPVDRRLDAEANILKENGLDAGPKRGAGT